MELPPIYRIYTQSNPQNKSYHANTAYGNPCGHFSSEYEGFSEFSSDDGIYDNSIHNSEHPTVINVPQKFPLAKSSSPVKDLKGKAPSESLSYPAQTSCPRVPHHTPAPKPAIPRPFKTTVSWTELYHHLRLMEEADTESEEEYLPDYSRAEVFRPSFETNSFRVEEEIPRKVNLNGMLRYCARTNIFGYHDEKYKFHFEFKG